MTDDEIISAAAKGLPLPKNGTIPQRFLYRCVKHIYSAYYSGSLTIEEAKAEKTSLMADYYQLTLWEKMILKDAQTRNRVNAVTAPLGKSNCPKCRAIYAILCGDMSDYNYDFLLNEQEADNGKEQHQLL